MRNRLLLALLCLASIASGQAKQKPVCQLDLNAQVSESIKVQWSQHVKNVSTRLTDEDTLVLPVVFHIIHQGGPENLSDPQVLQALQTLNEGFANEAFYDQGSGIDTRIRFCLARQDPQGRYSTGINHVYADLPEILPSVHDAFLKSLINWDTEKYINIWVVKEIVGFIEQQACDKSDDLDIAGYATFPSSHGNNRDGIVAEARNLSSVIIHEMGHYLGLLHTFEGCDNSDCTQAGDQVCDTPPQSEFGAKCDGSSNTCQTDTESGFTTDQNDLPHNFMDYSGCPHDFTQGQKDRMRFMILNVRSSLLNQLTCEPNCSSPEDASFSFTYKSYKLGDEAIFTHNGNSGSMEWRVNGNLVSTATVMNYTFMTQGWFKIELLVKSASTDACSHYQVNWIRVYCAIKPAILANKEKTRINEPVQFSATLEHLTTDQSPASFEWYQNGEIFSTVQNPVYSFQTAGDKIIFMVTRKGNCADTSNYLLVRVKPHPDYTLNLKDPDCTSRNHNKMVFTICNKGDKALPPGLPISFYQSSPTLTNAPLVGTYFTNAAIGGFCCKEFEYDLPEGIDFPGGYIYGVVNDNGSLPRPYNFDQFPVTVLPESNYHNNMDSMEWDPFRVRVSPRDTLVLFGQNIDLLASVNDSAGVFWTSTRGLLSCDTCLLTNITAEGYTRIIVRAVSKDGCIDRDTAYVRISVNQDILIPSAFTPNQDFKNDWFYVLGNKEVATISRMAVFNRWGEMVFERKQFTPNIPDLGWDGKYKGKDAALATYVYYVAVDFLDGSRKEYKGTVVLVR